MRSSCWRGRIININRIRSHNNSKITLVMTNSADGAMSRCVNAHDVTINLHLHLDLLLFEAATNQTLGGSQCVLGVGYSLQTVTTARSCARMRLEREDIVIARDRRLLIWYLHHFYMHTWRLAGWPTRRSESVKATTEGVVRAPSAFSITRGCDPSITATHELVVPRSIPITEPLMSSLRQV